MMGERLIGPLSSRFNWKKKCQRSSNSKLHTVTMLSDLLTWDIPKHCALLIVHRFLPHSCHRPSIYSSRPTILAGKYHDLRSLCRGEYPRFSWLLCDEENWIRMSMWKSYSITSYFNTDCQQHVGLFLTDWLPLWLWTHFYSMTSGIHEEDHRKKYDI